MDEIKNTELPVSTTDLAYEGTTLAYERTLMAWLRTSISMISFGFTISIYKFFQESSITGEPGNRLFTPRVVGMVMIGFGLIALLLAQIQHQIAVKKLRTLSRNSKIHVFHYHGTCPGVWTFVVFGSVIQTIKKSYVMSISMNTTTD